MECGTSGVRAGIRGPSGAQGLANPESLICPNTLRFPLYTLPTLPPYSPILSKLYFKIFTQHGRRQPYSIVAKYCGASSLYIEATNVRFGYMGTFTVSPS